MADELLRRLNRLSTVIRQAADEAKINALNNLEASYKTRIFSNGKNSSGGDIGSYSTSPIYVSIEGAKESQGSQARTSSLTPKGKGKDGAAKFKNGKTKKSQYFADGYSGFRAQVGRQNSKVDFNLTGNLQESIVGGTKKNGIVLGYRNTDAEELAENLEERFSDTFDPTDDEINEALDNIENTIFDAILGELS